MPEKLDTGNDDLNRALERMGAVYFELGEPAPRDADNETRRRFEQRMRDTKFRLWQATGEVLSIVGIRGDWPAGQKVPRSV